MMKFSNTEGIQPCPNCGEYPSLDDMAYTYTIYCSECYDGAPDSGAPANILGCSYYTMKLAIKDWNEKVEDFLEDNKK